MVNAVNPNTIQANGTPFIRPLKQASSQKNGFLCQAVDNWMFTNAVPPGKTTYAPYIAGI